MRVQPFAGFRDLPPFHCITGALRHISCACFLAETAGIPGSDRLQQQAGELQKIGARGQAAGLLFSGASAAGVCASGIGAEVGKRMMEMVEEVFWRRLYQTAA